MLDELKCPSDEAAAGFPDHPHRGFETCTIVFQGEVSHADSMGNKGVIRDGGVQWMTVRAREQAPGREGSANSIASQMPSRGSQAGRGIIHSEFPAATTDMLWGFQLWINLPAKDKMCKPRQDFMAPSGLPRAFSTHLQKSQRLSPAPKHAGIRTTNRIASRWSRRTT